jgi:hypothetical protein
VHLLHLVSDCMFIIVVFVVISKSHVVIE